LTTRNDAKRRRSTCGYAEGVDGINMRTPLLSVPRVILHPLTEGSWNSHDHPKHGARPLAIPPPTMAVLPTKDYARCRITVWAQDSCGRSSRCEQFSLPTNELEFFFFVLAFAGSDTTKNALAIGLQAFVSNPDQIERYREEESLRSTAVEEVLRWASPVAYWTRTAKLDVEMDQRIPTGGVDAAVAEPGRGGLRPTVHLRYRSPTQSAFRIRRWWCTPISARCWHAPRSARCWTNCCCAATASPWFSRSCLPKPDHEYVDLRRDGHLTDRAIGGSVNHPQRGLRALVDRGAHDYLQCSGISPSATCTSSESPISNMSGTSDSQNPLASHNVS
jgi:hypothetical protein